MSHAEDERGETKADRENALRALDEGTPRTRESFADVVARHNRAEEQRRAAEAIADEMARENNGAGERYKPRIKDNIRPISWGISAQEIAASRSRSIEDILAMKPKKPRKPRR